MKTISIKLGNMRKPQTFIVYPKSSGPYVIQSDKSIGRFDDNGKGVLCTKGCYMHHLIMAQSYQFPEEIVNWAKQNRIAQDEVVLSSLIGG